MRLHQQHPQIRTGWRDGTLGASRRVYKLPKRQEMYNKWYDLGRRMALHAFAQRIADAYCQGDNT